MSPNYMSPSPQLARSVRALSLIGGSAFNS
jgi:hypothetical protein